MYYIVKTPFHIDGKRISKNTTVKMGQEEENDFWYCSFLIGEHKDDQPVKLKKFSYDQIKKYFKKATTWEDIKIGMRIRLRYQAKGSPKTTRLKDVGVVVGLNPERKNSAQIKWKGKEIWVRCYRLEIIERRKKFLFEEGE